MLLLNAITEWEEKNEKGMIVHSGDQNNRNGNEMQRELSDAEEPPKHSV